MSLKTLLGIENTLYYTTSALAPESRRRRRRSHGVEPLPRPCPPCKNPARRPHSRAARYTLRNPRRPMSKSVHRFLKMISDCFAMMIFDSRARPRVSGRPQTMHRTHITRPNTYSTHTQALIAVLVTLLLFRAVLATVVLTALLATLALPPSQLHPRLQGGAQVRLPEAGSVEVAIAARAARLRPLWLLDRAAHLGALTLAAAMRGATRASAVGSASAIGRAFSYSYS